MNADRNALCIDASCDIDYMAKKVMTDTTIDIVTVTQHIGMVKNLRPLFEALTINTSVTVLCVIGPRLNPQELKMLEKLLKSNMCITTLELSYCDLAAHKLEDILTALTDNTTIEALGVSGNPIRSVGAAMIARFVESHPQLIELSVDETVRDVVGLQDLFQVLAFHPNLTYLHCGRNHNLGLRGAECIASALEINTSLVYLTCKNNDMGDAGVKTLFDKLHDNVSLMCLNAQGNYNGYLTCKSLVQCLTQNNTLMSVSLDDKFFTDTASGICNMIGQRPTIFVLHAYVQIVKVQRSRTCSVPRHKRWGSILLTHVGL